MPKFCANLTLLFNEVDFLDRFAGGAGRVSGRRVPVPVRLSDKDAARPSSSTSTSSTQVLHNLPAGDWAKGERGIGCQPERVGEFQDGVGKAIEYATALGCKQVNCLAGIAPARRRRGRSCARRSSTICKFAAPRLKDAGIKLLIEPINTRDIPGFYLTRTRAGARHHRRRSARTISSSSTTSITCRSWKATSPHDREEPRADRRTCSSPTIPGRNEPGTGEINYEFLFGIIDRIGYKGWIGCEYKPKTTTVPLNRSWRSVRTSAVR